MNMIQNRTLHPNLRDEEALVVENAIRLAIDSIINVLYGVNSARTHEFQRMVADRDKEIQRLESRLKDIDHELLVPRRQGCTCGIFEKATASHSHVQAQTVGNPQMSEETGFDPRNVDPEMSAVQQECDMSISLGFFARPSSHVSSQSQESALPSSPCRIGLGQSCTSHSSGSSALSEAVRNLPASPTPSGLVIKEEPCDMDAVFIEWEMSEEAFREQNQGRSSLCLDKGSSSETRLQEEIERRHLVDLPPSDIRCDPDRHHVTDGEQLRNRKKGVPMSQLPEEAQRLKRAAWRAASRRYYARKIARQQTNPSHSTAFPLITDPQYSQPTSFVDRRRTLISDLPDESQLLQRESWRAASRRYYAKKNARFQNEPMQYVQLLQNIEPPEETLGANSGGSHSSSGGIMCS